jgi:hypothetical protein
MVSTTLHRRDLLRLGVGTLATPLFAASSDFWNKKEAAEWSTSEVELLRTKSPWAKKVRMEVVTEMAAAPGISAASSSAPGGRGGRGGGGGGAGGGGGEGGAAGGGGGDFAGGGGGEGGGGGRSAEAPEVLVRWASAKPFLDQARGPMPPDFDGHYVISVTGIPDRMLWASMARRGRGAQQEAPPPDPDTVRKQMVDKLLAATRLSVKGKDPQGADMIRQSNDQKVLFFGFQKQSLPLQAADKDLQFQLRLPNFAVKVKFDPKEMLYKGELAL